MYVFLEVVDIGTFVISKSFELKRLVKRTCWGEFQRKIKYTIFNLTNSPFPFPSLYHWDTFNLEIFVEKPSSFLLSYLPSFFPTLWSWISPELCQLGIFGLWFISIYVHSLTHFLRFFTAPKENSVVKRLLRAYLRKLCKHGVLERWLNQSSKCQRYDVKYTALFFSFLCKQAC